MSRERGWHLPNEAWTRRRKPALPRMRRHGGLVANHRRQRRFDGLACGKSVQYAGHSASLNRRSPRSGQADGRLERIHVLVSCLAQAQRRRMCGGLGCPRNNCVAWRPACECHAGGAVCAQARHEWTDAALVPLRASRLPVRHAWGRTTQAGSHLLPERAEYLWYPTRQWVHAFWWWTTSPTPGQA